MTLIEGIAQILLDQHIPVRGYDQEGGGLHSLTIPYHNGRDWIDITMANALVQICVYEHDQRAGAECFDLGVPAELDRLLDFISRHYDSTLT